MKPKKKPVIATVILLTFAFFITETVIIQNGIFPQKSNLYIM